MKVKELKELLADIPDDWVIILARDSEGNGFNEAIDYSKEYIFDGTHIGYEKLTPELQKEGYSEDDVIKGIKSFILWP